jgi:hypothetical protein
MKESVSINDIGKGPYAVAAKFVKDKGIGHGSLLMGGKQETVMSMAARESEH